MRDCEIRQPDAEGDNAEYVDVLTPEGSPTGRRERRAIVHRTGLWHSSIHMWLINTADENKVLLQKRSVKKESYPGKLDASAAGHVDAGEVPIDAAVRETREELGVRLEKNNIEYVCKRKLIIAHPERNFISNEWNYVYICFGDFTLRKPVPDAGEIESLKWLSAEDVDEIYLHHASEICVDHDEWTAVKSSSIRLLNQGGRFCG